MGLLDGKVAVVTGGGTGIGRAVSLGLAAAGASGGRQRLRGQRGRAAIRRARRPTRSSRRSARPAARPWPAPESVATMAGGKAVIELALEGVRRPPHPRLLRRHPARADDLQHERGGVGRGHRRPPQGPLHGDAAGHRATCARRRPAASSPSRPPPGSRAARVSRTTRRPRKASSASPARRRSAWPSTACGATPSPRPPTRA